MQEQTIIKELDQDTYNYFRNVLINLDDKFDSDKDKALYVKNVFKATEGIELQLSCHSKLGFAIEKLIHHFTLLQTIKFFKVLSQDFISSMTNTSLSRIWETLLEVSQNHIFCKSNNNLNDNDESKKANQQERLDELIKLVSKCGSLATMNLTELISHPCTCPVITSLLEILSGCKVKSLLDRKRKESFKDNFKDKTSTALPDNVEIPKKFKLRLKKLVMTLSNLENIKDLMLEGSSSKVLQATLIILEKTDTVKCQSFIDSLLSKFKDEQNNINIHRFASNKTCSPILEKILITCSSETYTLLWHSYFKGNVKKLTIDPVANYVAQQLVRSCPTTTLLEQIFLEMASCWDEITAHRHLGVLVAMSESCARLNCCQWKFVECLTQCLHCNEPKERKSSLMELTLYWQFFEEKGKYKPKVNYHGSLLIQNMLQFQKPIALIESILKWDEKDLVAVICDKIGSRIFDAYVTSRTVGEKSRNNLATKLKGYYTSLACDVYGSRWVEQLWKSSNFITRLAIMKDMENNGHQIKNSKCGCFVYNLCGMELFKCKPDKWKEWQLQGVKKREMFETIFGGSSTNKKSKKQRT